MKDYIYIPPPQRTSERHLNSAMGCWWRECPSTIPEDVLFAGISVLFR
jgi:hypothetical protein